MLIDHTHRPWIMGTLAVGVGAVTLYFVLDYFTPGGGLRGGDTVGLWYGVAGSALMVFAGLISALRRLPSWWFLGQRRVWLRGHVWLGLLSGVLILCHSHFRMGGPLEFVLMVVVFLVIGSGILGLLIQQFIPAMIREQVESEAPISQLHEILLHMRDQSDDLYSKAIGELADEGARLRMQGFYLETARPWLCETIPRESPIAQEATSRDLFAQTAKIQGGPNLQAFLVKLEGFCNERRQLARQERLHRILHTWLLVHVPLSVMLLILGVAHVISALYW